MLHWVSSRLVLYATSNEEIGGGGNNERDIIGPVAASRIGSAGNETKDSKQMLHLEQSQT